MYYMNHGWDPIKRFNTVTFMCLSQVMTCISNTICRGHFFLFSDLRSEVVVRFVDIDGIVDHHCLNVLSSNLKQGEVYNII